MDVDVDMDHIGGVEEDCESEESDDENRNSTSTTWRTFQVCWLHALYYSLFAAHAIILRILSFFFHSCCYTIEHLSRPLSFIVIMYPVAFFFLR